MIVQLQEGSESDGDSNSDSSAKGFDHAGLYSGRGLGADGSRVRAAGGQHAMHGESDELSRQHSGESKGQAVRSPSRFGEVD